VWGDGGGYTYTPSMGRVWVGGGRQRKGNGLTGLSHLVTLGVLCVEATLEECLRSVQESHIQIYTRDKGL
jgi:hypothetical protein